jgi:cytochrome c oxidase assembly factor CtaG/putative copper export protein
MRAHTEEQPDLRAALVLRRLAIPLFVILGILIGWLALSFTGAAAPTVLGDSGPLGRLGLPVAQFVFQTSTAITIGALGLAVFVIPRAPRVRGHKKARGKGGQKSQQKSQAAGRQSVDRSEPPLDAGWQAALNLAQITSVVWTVSAVAVLLLTYVDTAGSQAYAGNFSAQLGQYVTQVASGQLWLLIVCLAALVSTLVFGLRSYLGIGLTLLLAVVILIPQALMGHSSEAAGHTQAVNSLGLHLVSIMAWLGGLIALALLAPKLTGRKDLADLVRRYSSVALMAFALIVFSGFFNAALRVHTLHDWFATPYGQVILVKTLLTIGLGAIGYLHRRFVIDRLAAQANARREFWRLLGVETLVFGAVMALGIVLSRSQPPVSQAAANTPTPAEILTGEPLPPYPTVAHYFTQWSPDPLWIVVALGASVAYIWGFVRLKRRGDDWPVLRLVMWLIGMVLLVYVTCGGPVVYGKVLFSGHMIQHMLIVMVVPLPMVMGAPVTLLMRAIAPRTDGSRGVREWVLYAVHTPYMRFWAHPIVAAVNFAGSLIVFYYSGIMWYSLNYHLGHEIMLIHFLMAGYLFAQSLVGIDPGVNRFGYPVRLLELLITMTFHAFFGISLVSGTSLIEARWFGNMGHGWFTALTDQQLGGSIAWGIGEFPTLLLAIGVVYVWTQSSEREAKRQDRAEARSGDAELRAYNEMLANLNKRGR